MPLPFTSLRRQIALNPDQILIEQQRALGQQIMETYKNTEEQDIQKYYLKSLLILEYYNPVPFNCDESRSSSSSSALLGKRRSVDCLLS